MGGCGRKLMVPKEIWLLSVIDLLCDEGEKSIESMTPTPKMPTASAN
jgi:hypothetical protein